LINTENEVLVSRWSFFRKHGRLCSNMGSAHTFKGG